MKTILEETTGIQFKEERIIVGSWNEVELTQRLLDEMVALSAANTPQLTGVKPGRNDVNTPPELRDEQSGREKADREQPSQVILYQPASLRVGTCNHQPCRWRSEAVPLSKSIIAFIAKYLPNEAEAIMGNRALFIGPEVDEGSLSVQCCGMDARDADKSLDCFLKYYTSIEGTLWIGEFPRCAMLDDTFCQFLLARMDCLLLNKSPNKTIVICERALKDKITNLLHKICAAQHDSVVRPLNNSDSRICASIKPNYETPVNAIPELKILISSDDITTLQADAIVCSNDEKLSSSSGLSKQIASIAGESYKKRCEELTKDKTFQPTDVISIDAKEHGIIINAIVPILGKSPEQLEQVDKESYKKALSTTLQKAIDEANRSAVSYLVITPLGEGKQRKNGQTFYPDDLK